jgi:hypothetical protein
VTDIKVLFLIGFWAITISSIVNLYWFFNKKYCKWLFLVNKIIQIFISVGIGKYRDYIIGNLGRVSLVGQELFNLSLHLSSPSLLSMCRFVLCIICFRSLHDFSSLFFVFAIILPVLLRITNFDYPLGVVNLFLSMLTIKTLLKWFRLVYVMVSVIAVNA